MENHPPQPREQGQPQPSFGFTEQDEEARRALAKTAAEASLTTQEKADGVTIRIDSNGEPFKFYPPEQGDQGYYK